MLSPPSRDGIEAFVRRVDGQHFKEHEIVQRKELGNKPYTTYGYLESEDNAEFEIGVTFHDSAKLRHRENDWKIAYSVDGRRITKRLCHRRKPDCVITTMKFAECGEVMKGNLKFTTLKTTAVDEEVTLAKEDLTVIGEIQVDLYRGITTTSKSKIQSITQGKTPNVPRARDLSHLPRVDLGVAHESDKKWSGAIGVGTTTYDTPSRSGSSESTAWSAIDKDKPYHRFIFKYRTTPILQLLKVITTRTSTKRSSISNNKHEAIYISDSDSEGESGIPITPAKRKINSRAEDTQSGSRAQRPDVKPKLELGLGVNRATT